MPCADFPRDPALDEVGNAFDRSMDKDKIGKQYNDFKQEYDAFVNALRTFIEDVNRLLGEYITIARDVGDFASELWA